MMESKFGDCPAVNDIIPDYKKYRGEFEKTIPELLEAEQMLISEHTALCDQALQDLRAIPGQAREHGLSNIKEGMVLFAYWFSEYTRDNNPRRLALGVLREVQQEIHKQYLLYLKALLTDHQEDG